MLKNYNFFLLAGFFATIIGSIKFALICNESSSDLLGMIITAICITLYCYYDSMSLKKPMVGVALFGILVYWPIGFLIYLIWSRGKKSIKMILLFSILFLLADQVPYRIALEFIQLDPCG